MKRWKKMLSLLMVLSMLVGMEMTVSAQENYEEAERCDDIELPENKNNEGEYFKLDNSDKRIDQDGNFSFSYENTMTSDTFKPKDSSITIYATATTNTVKNTYFIGVYRYSDDALMGSFIKYTADGGNWKHTWTGLDTNEKYYLYFSQDLGVGKVTGSGKIKYIQ